MIHAKQPGPGTLPPTDGSGAEPIPLKVADHHSKPALRKRVYETVSVAETASGFGIALDGREIKTPGRATLATPHKALADAIAEEWDSQKETIDPSTMPLSKLLNTCIDKVSPDRSDIIAELLRYVDTDALCYRAESPAALVGRQEVVWQPVLDWLAATHHVNLTAGPGLMPFSQPDEAHKGIASALEALSDYPLTAAQASAALSGSLALAIALAHRHLSGEEVFAASQLDETWQIEQWGEDKDALERRTNLRADLVAIAKFVELAV